MRSALLVEQCTPYTCALACLESFSRDRDLGFTQATLLRDHSSECFVGRLLGEQDISGALAPNEFQALAAKLGLDPRAFCDHRKDVVLRLLRDLGEAETVVFFIAKYDSDPGQRHFVRFSRILSEGLIEVMNPQRGAARLHELAWEELVAWDYTGFRLSAQAQG